MPRDGIPGYQFYNRLEFFAPYYSQFLLWKILRKPCSSLVLNILTKKNKIKIRETRMENGKMRLENQIKTKVREDKTLTKNAVQEYHLRFLF
jgi:hypothetical protein